mmetsp:Transcript_65064/g.153081  ORF Transcript_65064/g.153081 Transcript_65064/m.153081 type:complete len:399 (+) Transcript_65064:51-1247(+)
MACSGGGQEVDNSSDLVQTLLGQLKLQRPGAWMAATNSKGVLIPKCLLTVCKQEGVLHASSESSDREVLLQGLRGLLDARISTTRSPASDAAAHRRLLDEEDLSRQFRQLCREDECLSYQNWLDWEWLASRTGASNTAQISLEGARSLWLRIVGQSNDANEADFFQLARAVQEECGLATKIQSFMRGSTGRRKAQSQAEQASRDHDTSCLGNAVKLAPYNPTPACAIAQALEALHVQAGDLVYDLGCGDGRLLLGAARRGAKAVGIEYDARFAQKAQRAAQEAGLEELVTVICADALSTNLKPATKIFVYLVPDGLRKIEPALAAACRRGVPIASYLFSLSGWSPHDMLSATTRSSECKVWVYKDSTALPVQGQVQPAAPLECDVPAGAEMCKRVKTM